MINLRLKGTSTFGEEENAEGMLQVRGLVLAGRWNATFAKITASLASDRRLDWHWQSVDMTAELKTPAAVPIQGQLQLSLCTRKDFQQEVVAPAATAALHRGAVIGRMLLQQRQREAVEPGKILAEVLVAMA